MELIASLIQALSSNPDTLSTLSDFAKKSFDDTTVGRGINAFNKDDATLSSVFNATRQPLGQLPDQQMQAQQGGVGGQQSSYTQPQYMSGIPSLLQGYGSSSQGLLPLIGAR